MTAVARGSWDAAPCALLTLAADGTVLAANATALGWLGRTRDDLVGRTRFDELLAVGARIYWETHLLPLLHVERRLDEVAVEVRAAGGRLPVLLTAVARPAAGEPLEAVHVALVPARERLRYERELLAARAAAERSEARLRVLQRVSAALSEAEGVQDVADALLAAVAAVGAGAGTVWTTGPAGALEPRGSTGEPPGACPPPQLPAGGDGPAVRDGRLVVPLAGPRALQGALSLRPAPAPALEEPVLDAEVLAAVGRQGGLALERARLHEHHASVASELQRSLLAVEPPPDPRYAVAATYRPGVEALEVGGDWYDVFTAVDDPGVLSVVVGDVVGRGLHAASAMGQLRSAVRAVAGRGTGPAALLGRLDRFVEQVEAASLATVAHAQLDLGTGELRYACAGHLPPLLLPARGEPELLWGGRSTPLGAFGTPRERGEARVRLAPGDALVLCTDGLVERRDRGIDEGLDALVRAAAGVRGSEPAEAVRVLTGELLADETGRDDVCVLLVRWLGPEPRGLAPGGAPGA